MPAFVAGLFVTSLLPLGASAGEAPASPNEAEKPAESSAQGAPVPPAQTERDREVAELKRIIEELRKRVEQLEKDKSAQPAPPGTPARPTQPVPPDTTPTPPPTDPVPVPTAPTPPPGRGGATLLPNISIIGNLIGRAGDSKAVPGRGRTHFEELEIAFQDQVASKLRYDLFLSAEKEEAWKVGLEEGFLTATGVLPGVNLRVGRIRTPVGRFNPLHPHFWPFITQPSAQTALLGDHGLVSDGFVGEWVLPTRGFYSGLQFGRWENTSSLHGHSEEEEHEEGEHEEEEEDEHGARGFQGGEQGAYSARFLLGKALSRTVDLELGFSRYWGRGEVDGFGRKMLALNGIDLSYRNYIDAYRRLWLLAELYAHDTQGIRSDTKRRLGGFGMATYRWNRFWEAGARGDYTKYPFPMKGHEIGGSLFLTRYLNEQNSLRLELRHAKDPQFGHTNAVFLQLLFGSGPHVHPLW